MSRENNLKVYTDNRAFILYRIHNANVHGQLDSLILYAIKDRSSLIAGGWYLSQSVVFFE